MPSAAAVSVCVCRRRCREAISMADADDVRRLALALPHVAEIDSDGFDFRVADKGFVWSYPERRPGKPRRIRTDIAVCCTSAMKRRSSAAAWRPRGLLHHPRLRRTAVGHAAAGAREHRSSDGSRHRRVAHACPRRARWRARTRRFVEPRSGLRSSRPVADLPTGHWTN